MRPMERVQDLIEEAKVRTVFWAICVFAISYFLSRTYGLPLDLFCFVFYLLPILRWRKHPVSKQTYLSHLIKKQLHLEDSRLSTVLPTSRWKRKIESPLVEAAIKEFINKILQDFVIDLWDLVDLIGNQLDLYRKNQSEIGVNVMKTLSSEERDERLKRHLMASKELHPALFSPESEYKCPLVRFATTYAHMGCATMYRDVFILHETKVCCTGLYWHIELRDVFILHETKVRCTGLYRHIKLSSVWYINELIEYVFLDNKDNCNMEVKSDSLHSYAGQNTQSGQWESRKMPSNISSQLGLVQSGGKKSTDSSGHGHPNALQKDSVPPRPADWAMILEATTKRRSEVLAPENLENMWTKGRNYQKKTANLMKAGTILGSVNASSGYTNTTVRAVSAGKDLVTNANKRIKGIDENYMVHLMHGIVNNEHHVSYDLEKEQYMEMGHVSGNERNAGKPARSNNFQLKRSSSTPDMNATFMTKSDEGASSKESCHLDIVKHKEEQSSDVVLYGERSLHLPKIKCRVRILYCNFLYS
ncbi:hypothetical protein B296_00010419 [Ensete ventricosum]|uniref:PXA domain-containing protein n=1 Tax=Ensete ventricosum TaxID=4639 RepID=A0A427B037_ENSVE|nr:hypothetical protein B296_00010419 [Ensete ventricosum]